MISSQEFRRMCYFEYLEEDMLRGTVYYAKRKSSKNIKKYLSERPAYRVLTILKKEFEEQGYLKEYEKFNSWLNNNFSKLDKLHGGVIYFEKLYGTQIEAKRYLLILKNACDLYLTTEF